METIKIYKDGRGGCTEAQITLEEAWRTEIMRTEVTTWFERDNVSLPELEAYAENQTIINKLAGTNWDDTDHEKAELDAAMAVEEELYQAVLDATWNHVDSQGWYRRDTEKVVRVAE